MPLGNMQKTHLEPHADGSDVLTHIPCLLARSLQI